MATVYSYGRFSHPDQKRGHSAERQQEAARKWCRERGHVLNETLTDEGVSAFHGCNIFGEGSLGKFVAAVATGLVEPGAILLLESWDRFSRMSPWDVLTPLQVVINAGVTVVTLIDNKEWTREGLRAEPMKIIESIIVMHRAWEESRTKSHRIQEKWDKRRRAARDTGAPITGRAPAWVRLSDTDEAGKPFLDKEGRPRKGFVLVPERAAVVERIYRWADDGQGQEWIARELNRAGVPCWGNGRRVGKFWRRPHVKQILRSRAPGGFYTPMRVARDARGKASRARVAGVEEIPNYFPPAVDADLFRRVHAMALVGGPALVVHRPERAALAGLCRCAECGSGMTRVVKGKTPRAGKPRLVCAQAKLGKGCRYVSVVAEEVVDAILASTILLAVDKPEAADARAAAQEKRDALRALDARAGNLAAAVASTEQGGGPGSAPEALVAALRAAEAERAALRLEVAEAQASAEAADNRFVRERLGELWDIAQGPREARDPTRINLLLRQVFRAVLVDAERRDLSLVWKAGWTSTVGF